MQETPLAVAAGRQSLTIQETPMETQHRQPSPEKASSQQSLPIQDAASSPSSEVKELREEVASLRAAAQDDTKEREMLLGMIDRLKTELRHALDENRALTDGAEERKKEKDAQAAKRDAAARESALNSAKSLFKCMLDETENGRTAIENRNTNRHLSEGSQKW
jgi:chromosome segregation ATPase